MPTKPTGRIGPSVLRVGPAGVTGGWEQIQFPKTKEEIEEFVLNLWIAEVRRVGASILSAIRNEENDFDFTLELPGGTVSLDLVEVFYSDGEKRPYETTDIEVSVSRYAKQISESVKRESEHYGKAGLGRPIHLLLYVTHWKFNPTEEVIRLVQYLLNKHPPIFENVFFIAPHSVGLPMIEDLSIARVLYPSRDPLEGHSPSDFIDASYLVLDPAKGEVLSSGRGE